MNTEQSKSPGRCMTCREEITRENNGMEINHGDYFMCNDCHLMAYGVNIMAELLYFKGTEQALKGK